MLSCHGGLSCAGHQLIHTMQITIDRNGQHFGPYTPEEATAHIASGGLLATDWAWAEGVGGEWKPLSELLATLQVPPPAEPQPPAVPQPPAAPGPEDDPYATIVTPKNPSQ